MHRPQRPGDIVKTDWSSTKPRSMPRTTHGHWLVVVVLVLAGVVVRETVVRASSATPSTAVTQEITKAPARLTLRDGIAGYELDYPAGWRVEANEGWLTTLYSYPATTEVGAVQAPQSKIEIVPIPGVSAGSPADVTTLAQLAAQWMQAHEGAPPVWRQTAINGMPAVRTDIVTFSGEPARVILIVLDGQTLQFVGYGDLNAFDEIMSTLRRLHPVV